MILNQDVNKVSLCPDIPLKSVKENTDIFSDFYCACFNSLIKSRKFPKSLELADIIPLHKKGKKDIKGNYRAVSIFPNLRKIFKKYIFTQMSQFLTIYFRNVDVVSERALVHRSVF